VGYQPTLWLAGRCVTTRQPCHAIEPLVQIQHRCPAELCTVQSINAKLDLQKMFKEYIKKNLSRTSNTVIPASGISPVPARHMSP